MRRIAQACEFPVALIVAPAGYGKTVALRQYLDSLDVPHVRFDVRPEHETLTAFVRGFAEAITDVAPEMRNVLGDALKGQSTAPQLAAWAATHLWGYRGVVAIDDFHLAADPEIAVFLRSLIARFKGDMRWILVSRSMPDLPIASWMAYGDMDIAMDEHDLAFTIDEAKEAGRETGALEEDLRRLVEMTGGWATALSFAMRSRMRSCELEAIAHTTREMVYRYLAEQLYQQLNEAQRLLLHVAAFMPVIDVDVLTIAGFPDAYSLLEQLRTRTSFLSIDGPRIYRCHDLFRDFLVHQVDLMGTAVSENIRRRTALAYWQAGRLSAALHLYTELRACDEIRAVLGDLGLELLDKGLWDAVSDALQVLPAEITENDAHLLAIQAAVDKSKGRFHRAESLLKRAMPLAEELPFRASLIIRLAHLGFEQSRDVADLLQSVDRKSLPTDLAGEIVSYLLATHAWHGRVSEADSLFPLALQYAAEVESQLLRARLFYRCAMAGIILDRPDYDAERLLARALELADNGALYLTSSAVLVALGHYSIFYRQDYFSAAAFSERAIERAKRSGDVFSVQLATVFAINAHADIADFVRVESLLSELPTWQVAGHGRTQFSSACRAMLLARQHQFAAAYDAIGGSPNLYNFDRVLNAAMRALYAFAMGRQMESQKLCTDAIEQLKTQKYLYEHGKGTAEIARLIAALVFHLCNKGQAARAARDMAPVSNAPYCIALDRFVRKALSPAGVDRTDLLEMRCKMGEHGRGGVAEVLETVLLRSGLCSARAGLTPAEVEVLSLLDGGLVPKQIAIATARSVHTVRTLVQRAAEKLGCSGRQETLAMARRIGLVGHGQQDAPPHEPKASEL